jgi:hypothetical protein
MNPDETLRIVSRGVFRFSDSEEDRGIIAPWPGRHVLAPDKHQRHRECHVASRSEHDAPTPPP